MNSLSTPATSLPLGSQLMLYARDLSEAMRQSRELEMASFTALYRLARRLGRNYGESEAHILRVSLVSRLLALRLGMDENEADTLSRAATLHDLGKICIPRTIFEKAGPLDPEERRLMQSHTQFGAELLSGLGAEVLDLAAEVAGYHHEHFDGSGYPHGLLGTEIPLSARIVRLADAYDALRSERPYKPAFEHDQALELLLGDGNRTHQNHFDPQILELFLDSQLEVRQLYTDGNRAHTGVA